MFKKLAMRNQKGFTMLELIVVIAILGILALVFLSQKKGATMSAKIVATEKDIIDLYEAAATYKANIGASDYSAITGIDRLVTAGLWRANRKSPFATAYTITSANGGANVRITVPAKGDGAYKACHQLAARLMNKGYTASCNNNTLTVAVIM